MSRWDDGGWYKPAPKRPPPKHGIKVKRSGSTWWGQRWIEALERVSREYSNRLARGRSYARAGRVHDLVLKAGRVTAHVTGSRATPYEVTIELVKLGDVAWTRAIAAMAEKAQFSAELLAGRMPQDIDAAFEKGRTSLFPVKEADLATACSCPDHANPCKHIAATHYVLGEALDRDPFLLFELRGRSRAQVLEALRTARAGAEGERSPRKGARRDSASPADVPGVSLGKLAAADYDEPRGPLPALSLSFEAPAVPGSLLRQLGAPSGWVSDASPLEVFGPMIRRAADRARSLAMGEVEPASAPEPGAKPSRGRARKGPRAGGPRAAE